MYFMCIYAVSLWSTVIDTAMNKFYIHDVYSAEMLAPRKDWPPNKVNS